jgi:hypothetical protein
VDRLPTAVVAGISGDQSGVCVREAAVDVGQHGIVEASCHRCPFREWKCP